MRQVKIRGQTKKPKHEPYPLNEFPEAASRRSQSVYECVACGHAENADANAAMNILGLGIGPENGRGGDGAVSGKLDQSGLRSVYDMCQEAA